MPDLTQTRLDDESVWALAALEELPGDGLRRLARLKNLARQKSNYTTKANEARNREILNLMKRELDGPLPGHPLWHELHNPVTPENRPHRGTRKRGN